MAMRAATAAATGFFSPSSVSPRRFSSATPPASLSIGRCIQRHRLRAFPSSEIPLEELNPSVDLLRKTGEAVGDFRKTPIYIVGVEGWPEHSQRMPSWHAASENSSAGDGRGAAGNGDSYMFGVPPRHQGLDHQGQLLSQGEPLQSSGGWLSARAWLDPLAAIHQPLTMAGQVGSFSHLVGAGAGGFMGFLGPAAAHQRLQGEDEQRSEAMRE